MKGVQANTSGVSRAVFVLFCVMIMIAGGVIVLDQGQNLYHDAPLAKDWRKTQLPDTAIPHHQSVPLPAPERPTPAAILASYENGTAIDLEPLVSRVLNGLAEDSSARSIESYLIWAIKAQKSDAYIDSMLNSAASRGHFQIPDALLTLAGRLDTPSLLTAVILAARQADPLPRPALYAAQHHPLRQTDSLAGLSLIYYGQPQQHLRIAQANSTFARMAEAEVGQIMKIPAL